MKTKTVELTEGNVSIIMDTMKRRLSVANRILGTTITDEERAAWQREVTQLETALDTLSTAKENK